MATLVLSHRGGRMSKHCLLLLFVIAAIPSSSLLSQAQKQLYCGACGKSNDLAYTFCYNCGARVEKTAQINNLRQKIALADSSNQPIVLTSSELQSLIQDEIVRYLKTQKSNQTMPARPKTKTQEALEVAIPIAFGGIFLYWISTVTSRRGIIQ
jgi:hypothetical protein